MSRKRSGPRIKANLSEGSEHHLKSYSIAAAAAGVGLLALAQPAEAEVLYARRIIPIGSTPVSIDFNRNGAADFQFQRNSYSVYHEGAFVTASVRSPAGGGVVGELGGGPRGDFYASALDRGTKIGPLVHFNSGGGAVIERAIQPFCFCSSGTIELFGNWFEVSNRYLGVKFLIDGDTHYGWVRLTVTSGEGIFTAQIDGYAYETIPDKPIVAAAPPEDPSAESKIQQTGLSMSPPSLGMLALGARGLALWRREVTLAF
jgi:hypothetical protein